MFTALPKVMVADERVEQLPRKEKGQNKDDQSEFEQPAKRHSVGNSCRNQPRATPARQFRLYQLLFLSL